MSGRLNTAVLFAALRPHLEMEERLSLDWGERFLDGPARRQLRDRFEYQGANIPAGARLLDFARHRNRTTRTGADGTER